MSLSNEESCLKDSPQMSSTTLSSGSTWTSLSPNYISTYPYVESHTSLLSFGALGIGTLSSSFVCPY
jgi:hypothetical protein